MRFDCVVSPFDNSFRFNTEKEILQELKYLESKATSLKKRRDKEKETEISDRLNL